jgi:archaellum component FlaC
MTEEPDSLVLRYLRRIDEKLDRLSDDVRDLKLRVTSLVRQSAEVVASQATLQSRMDRLETRIERIERIERRLDLVENPGR